MAKIILPIDIFFVTNTPVDVVKEEIFLIR